MTKATRRRILRANALFLILFGGSGFLLDLQAYFFGVGPQSGLIASAPHTAIGFVEAHGLAVIIGVLLWRAQPARSWHFTGAAVHVLLGASNLVFWQIFVASSSLPLGYVSTGFHSSSSCSTSGPRPALRESRRSGSASRARRASCDETGRRPAAARHRFATG